MCPPFLPGSEQGEHGPDTSRSTRAGVHPGRTEGALARRPWLWVGLVAAAAACLGWVPFVRRGLSPDEGGMLVLAGQWAPGSSLYGDYWVDRPPALVGLFAAADRLGGPTALRLIGVLVVLATVLLAGVIGRLAEPGRGAATVLPAVTAAVFVASPLFGGTVVNGELLGLPFVLAGIAAALASSHSSGRPAFAWAVLAGGAGVTAFLVKQSLADVGVVVLALIASQWRSSRRGGVSLTPLRLLAAGALVGGVAVTALAVGVAMARGTGAAELWEAVVVFRGEASGVIAESATSSTAIRLGAMTLALVASIAPFVAGALIWATRARVAVSPGRPEVDLRWPALALLAWEVFALLLGGSYWLHYLMGLVPGLVVLAAAAGQRRPSLRPLVATHLAAALATLGAVGWVVVHPIERPERPVISYLTEHAQPGDTAVVAFGGANILQATGLESPYPYLWSLPVRVRDPELHELGELLAGPEAPTWLVVSGSSLASWGVDGSAADEYVDERYALATTAGRFAVYRLEDAP